MRTDLENLMSEIVSAGWANASDGNVDAPTGFFARITIEPNEIASVRDAFDLPEEYDPPRYTLFQEDSSGFIHLTFLPTEVELLAAYDLLSDQYSEWNTEGYTDYE